MMSFFRQVARPYAAAVLAVLVAVGPCLPSETLAARGPRPAGQTVGGHDAPSAADVKIRKAAPAARETYAQGKVVVRFKKSKVDLSGAAGMSRGELFASKRGAKFGQRLGVTEAVLETGSGETVDQAVARLQKDPYVEAVSPDYVRELLSADPNDASFAQQWSLKNVGQTLNGDSGHSGSDIKWIGAMDVLAGSTSTGALVAVIDTGVDYLHPDLANVMWDGSSCKADDGSALGGCLHGYDFYQGDKDPLPGTNDHGTHVAGTIAAQTGNGIGIAGVNPQARVMALRVGNTGMTTSAIIRAVNFARQNGAKVINASFGAYGSTSAVEYLAIKDFTDAGGLFVAAAGNGDDYGNPYNHDSGAAGDRMYPADYSQTTVIGGTSYAGLAGIVTVAATTQTDDIAYFSDYGAQSVHVGAPGYNIQSTTFASTSSTMLNETFDGLTAPALPSWLTKNSGNWNTYALGGAWGKVLFTDGAFPYASNANTTATSLTYALSGSSTATLAFIAACDTEYATGADMMSVEFSKDGGANFASVRSWNEVSLDGDSDPAGYGVDIVSVGVDAQYLTDAFKFRFRWTTNGSDNSHNGCFIDSLSLSTSSVTSHGYALMNGTSMAAPHVAGLASLIWSYRPSLTAAEVKANILATGDPVAALSNKTVTGKRINAYRALASLADPTVGQLAAWSSTGKTTAVAAGAETNASVPYFEWDAPVNQGTIVRYDVRADTCVTSTCSVAGNAFSGTTTGTGFAVATTATGGTFQFAVSGVNDAGAVGSWHAIALRIDRDAPSAPSVSAPTYASGASVRVTGTAESGSTVTIYASGTFAASAQAAAGTFSGVVALPADGTWDVTAIATDTAGNASATGAAAGVTRDTVAPTATVEYSDTNPTNQDVVATLTGFSETGVTATSAGGLTHTFTANGSFRFTFADPAGNAGSATGVALNIFKTAPDVPTLSASPLFTSGATVSAIATTSAGAWVSAYAVSGATLVATGTANADGLTALVLPLADEGDNAFYAVASDPVGNISASGTAITVTRDSTAPGVPQLDALPATVTGEMAFSGAAETGATVTLVFDHVIFSGTGADTATGTAAGGRFSIEGSFLSEGANGVTVWATDAAGNASATAHVGFTVDFPPGLYRQKAVAVDAGARTVSYEIVTNESVTGSVWFGTASDPVASMVATGALLSGTGHVGTVTIPAGGDVFTWIAQVFDVSGNATWSQVKTVNFTDTSGPSASDLRVESFGTGSATVRFAFTEPHWSPASQTGVTMNGATDDLGCFLANLFGSGGAACTQASLTIDDLGGGNFNARAQLTNMVPGTRYAVTATLTDDYDNETVVSAVAYGPSAVTGSTVSVTGPVTLTGATSGQAVPTPGLNLTITSPSDATNALTGALSFSGLASILVSQGTWNGVLLPPTLVPAGQPDNADAAEISSLITALTTMVSSGGLIVTTTWSGVPLMTAKAGAQGAGLTAQGGTFALSFAIPGGTPGATLHLFRSEDGATWTDNAPDTTCVLDGASVCSLRTDKLSFFSVASLTPTSSSAAAPVASSGGGGGGSSLRMDACPDGDLSPSYYDRSCDAAQGGTFTSASGSAVKAARTARGPRRPQPAQPIAAFTTETVQRVQDGVADFTATSASDASDKIWRYALVDRSITVRGRAHVKAKAVGTLARNARVELLSQKDGWSKIAFGKGKVGFVRFEYLADRPDVRAASAYTSARTAATYASRTAFRLDQGQEYLVVNVLSRWLEITSGGKSGFIPKTAGK